MKAVHALPDDTVRIEFFFVKDIDNIGFFEEYFIDKYKPALNITTNYHKIRKI